jgi:CheY-like chemotaxis protein
VAEARKRVLCIEDERETAALVTEDLAGRGFDVTSAYDGHEGFVSILQNVPDLILCDINLPHISGFELLERLNALVPHLGHVPFVFLTALADRDTELRARRLGAENLTHEEPDAGILLVRSVGGEGGKPPRLPGDKLPYTSIEPDGRI